MPAALITGCSKPNGIGVAIARALATDGFDLFLSYFDADMPPEPHPILAVQAALQAQGVQVVCEAVDLRPTEAPAQLMAAAYAAVGPVDVLVNNAAYSIDTTLAEMSATLLTDHLLVNGRAMMLLTQAFVELWQAGGKTSGGRVVNLTSGQGYSPMSDNIAYASSKGVVDAFTFNAAPELMRYGITINAVDPGPTDTGWMTDDLRAELAAHSPAGRVGTPEDAAQTVRWLVSGEAAWVTGQIIRARGGL
jgi:3-oxoacyl-[acyl-carrier protein] reductase